MNATLPAYIGGIVRIITTLAGGWLAQRGWCDQATVEGIAGSALLVATGIWSIIAKRRALLTPPPVPGAVPGCGVLGCLLPLGISALLLSSGCAVVHGSAGDSGYTGFAFGEKASTTLAGLNITETQTEGGQITLERGVGIDQSGATGEADLGKILGNLLLLGLQSQGLPAPAASPPATATATAPPPSTPAAACTNGNCEWQPKP